MSLPVTPRFFALPGFGLFRTSGSEIICPVENHTHLFVLLVSRVKKFTCRSGKKVGADGHVGLKRIEKKENKVGKENVV